MNLIIHQALKDLRLLRWLLLAWVLVLVACHGVVLYVLTLTQPDRQLLSSLETVETILSFAGAAAFIVLAAFLVQNDSPVTTTDFWLTRPISGGTMLASKLLTAAVILWALPLLGDAIDLAVAGVDVRALGISRMALQLAWLLPIMAIAACTSGLSQFVLVAIIEVLLVMVLGNAAYALGNSPHPRATLAPAVTLDMFACMPIVLAIPLFAYPYLTRRVTRAAVLLGIAPVVVAVVVGLATYALAETESTGDGLRGVSISVDPTAVRLTTRGDGTAFEVPLTITGGPLGTRIGAMLDKGWLQIGNKRVGLGELAAGGAPDASREEDLREDAAKSLGAALDGATLLPSRWNVFLGERRRLMLVARSRDLESAGTAPATLHLELRAYAWRFYPVGSVPVRARARLTAGSRSVVVLGVSVNRDGATVWVREAGPYEGFTFGRFLLRNLVRKQAVIPLWVGGDWFGNSPRVVTALLPVSATLAVWWRHLEIDARYSVSAEWLRDAELVPIEMEPAGHGKKTIEIPLVVNR